MADLVAICPRCGAEKDLPLGRCAACRHLPEGEEREVAVVCSVRVLDRAALVEAQARIRRGEPVRPSAELRVRARTILAGEAPPMRLSNGQIAGLVAANLLVTPLVGYAVWFRYRTRPGPAARQALYATLPVSVVLAVAIVAFRWALMRG